MRKFQFFPWLVAAFLPLFFFNFRYYPILDDYIQFGCYPLYSDVSYVFTTIGTLSTRPLAGLLDPLFWGQFYNIPSFSLVLITGLHLFSAFFFYKLATLYHISLSPLFFVVYLFLPLGMEGRFWLSASTRIIVGMFFASLSLYLLALFFHKDFSYLCLFAFSLVQLISLCFYESVALFSILCSLSLVYIEKKNIQYKKNLFALLITVLTLALLLFYYIYFRDLGLQNSRVNGISVSRIFPNICQLFSQIMEILSSTSIIKSSILGIKILCLSGFKGAFFLFLIMLLSICFSRQTTSKIVYSKREIFLFFRWGLLLFFLPFLPHALTDTVWLTNRSFFASIPGFALILLGFFKLFHKKHLQKLTVFILSFVFLTANIYEYNTYLLAGQLDDYILQEIVCQIDEKVLLGEKNLQVVLPEKILLPQHGYYKDHIASVFNASWALTGALRAKTKCLSLKQAEPVLKGEKIDPNAQIIELSPLKTYLEKIQ